VLDLACGNGVMLPTLSGRFGRVVGVDLHVGAAERLRRARGLQNVSIVLSDAMHLPFRECSFPFILALSALEHFKDLDFLVQEIHRVLAPGGYFLFLCPTESLFYRMGRTVLGYRKPEDHYHTADEVQAILRRHLIPEREGRYPSWAPMSLAVYRMGRFRRY
ncbi:MAG: class I SAM-dependent methyltransferase, partial [Deltaproteobacteria bacterium]|nr:class I SAM-dependent methyltransferase [Deltaproteobacteria bacterium]